MTLLKRSWLGLCVMALALGNGRLHAEPETSPSPSVEPAPLAAPSLSPIANNDPQPITTEDADDEDDEEETPPSVVVTPVGEGGKDPSLALELADPDPSPAESLPKMAPDKADTKIEEAKVADPNKSVDLAKSAEVPKVDDSKKTPEPATTVAATAPETTAPAAVTTAPPVQNSEPAPPAAPVIAATPPTQVTETTAPPAPDVVTIPIPIAAPVVVAAPPPAPLIVAPPQPAPGTAIVTLPSDEPYYPGPFAPIVLSALIQQHKEGGPLPINLSRIPVLGDTNKNANTAPGVSRAEVEAALLTPALPEVSIILNGKSFIPSVFRIRSGIKTKLFFTSVQKKPSAVVIEKLTVQRWIAQHDSQFGQAPVRERPRKEDDSINREVNSQKMTEIVLDPQPGKYGFHDPLSGARGEIIVE
ncbi:MAG: hypothetical protein HYR96_05460 [Deltaproteobacteria bacterium]|nr:hypothetical protein [Deltaproteobacteria bacterium]MBI3294876.1 hypothetical protein [Deltaproteobacteria bacterium]